MIPKLSLPSYELVLPSNKTKVKFRPFTVKERSILLLALQEDNTQGIINAISDIIRVCTFNTCELSKLPIVDAEYLFINIRNKSVGEDLDIIHTCQCGKENDVRLSMEKMTIEGDSISTNIDLGNNNWVIMKYPTFSNSAVLSSEPTEDEVLTVISSCIDSIIQGDAVFKACDSTLDELKEFVLSLTQPQLTKIEEFFMSLPKVVIAGEYACSGCGTSISLKIEGLENFFD